MLLTDGYQTLITFSVNPSVALKFAEKTVTPPGLDGGDAIDTTTMRNANYRTKAPRALKTLTEAPFTAAYDPEVLVLLNDLINVNQLITITFPDGSSVDFWGYLRIFTPGENTEGEQPTADATIECTNQDNTGAEVAPVYNAAA